MILDKVLSTIININNIRKLKNVPQKEEMLIEIIKYAIELFKSISSDDIFLLLSCESSFLSAMEYDDWSKNSIIKAIVSLEQANQILDVLQNDTHNYNKYIFLGVPYDEYNKGCPRDAFHKACKSHITRLENMLRTPPVLPVDKDLIFQRLINMKNLLSNYIQLQKTLLIK